MRRYFAVVVPEELSAQVMLIAGYERDAKVLKRKNTLGFALDYFPEEKAAYKKEWGKMIISDHATRKAAMVAVRDFFR